MMYEMDTAALKALHEYRREDLARCARPRRDRQRRSLRRRIAGMVPSIGSWTSAGRVADQIAADGYRTDTAAAT